MYPSLPRLSILTCLQLSIDPKLTAYVLRHLSPASEALPPQKKVKRRAPHVTRNPFLTLLFEASGALPLLPLSAAVKLKSATQLPRLALLPIISWRQLVFSGSWLRKGSDRGISQSLVPASDRDESPGTKPFAESNSSIPRLSPTYLNALSFHARQ